MLKQLTVTNRRGMSFPFEFEENDSGFQIAEIEGLDPVKAILVSGSFAGLDGEQFQSAKRGARDIKISMHLQPDFVVDTYTTLRRKMYTYFQPKQLIKLRFLQSSGLYLDIVGVVEEHVSPMFSEDPVLQILLRCFQPDFVDPRTVVIEAETVSTSTTIPVTYPGTVEAGTLITIELNRTLPDFTIYNTGEDGIMNQLDFNGDLINGDQLIISSIPGSKGITRIRAGVSSPYLFGRTAQSGWIQFMEGVNQFRIYAPGDPVPYKVEYLVRYGEI